MIQSSAPNKRVHPTEPARLPTRAGTPDASRGLNLQRTPPNNGMHPTANSAALIRETPCLMRCVRGG
jgi:hypothetical protein